MSASILKTLAEKGRVIREKVKETIRKLDLLDDVRDGKIRVNDLRAGDFFDATWQKLFTYTCVLTLKMTGAWQ